jgi:polygalacturonase
MKRIAVLSVLALSISFCIADTPPAATEPKVFNARDFGAKGDGTNLDTAAIQAALDACAKAGGGSVLLSPGIYLSKPITLGTKTTFVIAKGATLKATDNTNDFANPKKPGPTNFVAFVGGEKLDDVTITGGGVIDGSGGKWWIPAEEARRIKPGYTMPRPNLVALEKCKNLRMENITLQNSPKFHFVPTECIGVVISNVTVLAPEHAANTDGIDPSNCRNVLITRCRIDVGDDNIAIKAGKKRVEGREFASENITVTDCTFLHGHGLSVGSESVGGLRGLTVKNCTFEDTDNGIRIKSRRTLGGVVEDVHYSDITMKNVHPAISIACYYQDSSQTKFPTNDVAQPMTNTTPIFRNITIKNLTATSTKDAGLIVGLPESLIENITLENVTIKAKEGLKIANARGVTLTNVKIIPEKGEPVTLFNAKMASAPVKPAN